MAGRRTLASGSPRDWNMGNILSERSQEQGERFTAWISFRGDVTLGWTLAMALVASCGMQPMKSLPCRVGEFIVHDTCGVFSKWC